MQRLGKTGKTVPDRKTQNLTHISATCVRCDALCKVRINEKNLSQSKVVVKRVEKRLYKPFDLYLYEMGFFKAHFIRQGSIVF